MTLPEAKLINLLHPQVRSPFIAFERAVEQGKGIGLRIVSSFRTPEEQGRLWRIGRELKEGTWVKVGPTVTNARAGWSEHNWGVAVDVCPEDYLNNPSWNPQGSEWQTVIEVAKGFGIEHSVSWDLPHLAYLEGHTVQEWIAKFPDLKLPLDYFRA